MCGEHTNTSGLAAIAAGSSPHVRGAQVKRGLVITAHGIIPACAGSTHRSREYYYAPRDHPRMCGEHGDMELLFQHRRGSSPHVRGARSHRRCGGHGTGIIPACAGSTCGHELRDSAQRGSSPHVRGAPDDAKARAVIIGIIPACAGSTLSDAILRFDSWDHPRMCGEHISPACAMSHTPGSSPHVRGALAGTVLQLPCQRDHPRMCGEHCSGHAPTVKGAGSSPHVRGAR